jgi:intracellular sulfur oxidation DsrE/DsrF family protein
MTSRFDRRAFFGALTGVAAALPSAAQSRSGDQASAPQWDFAWLDQLKGKHKQVFDAGAFELGGDDGVLRLPNNYLNTFRDALHAEPPDVNVAVGIARTAFPLNASDALWDKYKIGAAWNIKGSDGKPATRNIFLGEAGGRAAPTVRSLAARGVVFWQCNIALGGIANQLSRESGIPFDKVRAELVSGLNPGVKVVPAHSMAVGLAQERGFTYMKV